MNDGHHAVLSGLSGLIGLRLVASERFAQVIVANTGLPVRTAGVRASTPGSISARAPVLPSASSPTAAAPGAERGGEGSREAPFPDESWQGGARRFPALVPTITPRKHASVARERGRGLDGAGGVRQSRPSPSSATPIPSPSGGERVFPDAHHPGPGPASTVDDLRPPHFPPGGCAGSCRADRRLRQGSTADVAGRDERVAVASPPPPWRCSAPPIMARGADLDCSLSRPTAARRKHSPEPLDLSGRAADDPFLRRDRSASGRSRWAADAVLARPGAGTFRDAASITPCRPGSVFTCSLVPGRPPTEVPGQWFQPRRTLIAACARWRRCGLVRIAAMPSEAAAPTAACTAAPTTGARSSPSSLPSSTRTSCHRPPGTVMTRRYRPAHRVSPFRGHGAPQRIAVIESEVRPIADHPGGTQPMDELLVPAGQLFERIMPFHLPPTCIAASPQIADVGTEFVALQRSWRTQACPPRSPAIRRGCRADRHQLRGVAAASSRTAIACRRGG